MSSKRYNNYKLKYPNYNYDKLEGKQRYISLLSQKEPEILSKWRKEQEELKKKLIKEDDPSLKEIKYIGGVDISFDKNDSSIGISALVICDSKTLKIVYEDYELIKIEEPYIPGFLAFREVKHFVKLIEKLKNNNKELIPQVILVDGNGIHHIKGFGLASHLGVLVDIPTIGCSKTVFALDGITKKKVEEIDRDNLKNKGDTFKLIGNSGTHWGYVYKSNINEDPLIINLGNKICNDTSLNIVKNCCINNNRIPEPIRLSDKISRRLIWAHHNFVEKFPKKKWDLKRYLKEKNYYIHNKL